VPAQIQEPSFEVAESESVYPGPTGIPVMTAWMSRESVELVEPLV
jgi:hypothetical protein